MNSDNYPNSKIKSPIFVAFLIIPEILSFLENATKNKENTTNKCDFRAIK